VDLQQFADQSLRFTRATPARSAVLPPDALLWSSQPAGRRILHLQFSASLINEFHSPQGGVMNWDQIQGKWKQSTGAVKEKWGKLTDDDLTVIAGKKDQLVGKIQERYGIAKDAAEKQVDDFTSSYNASSADLDRASDVDAANRERARTAGKS
jgi:uncharacterized protein YjbJ (UPF0337 family)